MSVQELGPASKMKERSWCPPGMADSSGSCRSCLAQHVAVLEPHLQPWGSAVRRIPPYRTNVAHLSLERNSSGAVSHPSLCTCVLLPQHPAAGWSSAATVCFELGTALLQLLPSSRDICPVPGMREVVHGVADLGLCPSPLAASMLALWLGLEQHFLPCTVLRGYELLPGPLAVPKSWCSLMSPGSARSPLGAHSEGLVLCVLIPFPQAS